MSQDLGGLGWFHSQLYPSKPVEVGGGGSQDLGELGGFLALSDKITATRKCTKEKLMEREMIIR